MRAEIPCARKLLLQYRRPATFIIQVFTLSNPLLRSITSNIIALIGDPLYVKGVNHWASSSMQLAKCVVEPGTAADIGVIVSTSCLLDHLQMLTFTKLGIVGNTRTPFAVSNIACLPHLCFLIMTTISR